MVPFLHTYKHQIDFNPNIEDCKFNGIYYSDIHRYFEIELRGHQKSVDTLVSVELYPEEGLMFELNNLEKSIENYEKEFEQNFDELEHNALPKFIAANKEEVARRITGLGFVTYKKGSENSAKAFISELRKHFIDYAADCKDVVYEQKRKLGFDPELNIDVSLLSQIGIRWIANKPTLGYLFHLLHQNGYIELPKDIQGKTSKSELARRCAAFFGQDYNEYFRKQFYVDEYSVGDQKHNKLGQEKRKQFSIPKFNKQK